MIGWLRSVIGWLRSVIGCDQVVPEQPEPELLDEGGLAKKRRVSAATDPAPPATDPAPPSTGPAPAGPAVSEQQAEVQPDSAPPGQ